MKNKSLSLLPPWLVVVGTLAAACSLTAPSADSLFGEYSAESSAGTSAGTESTGGKGDVSGSGGKAGSSTEHPGQGGAAGGSADGGTPGSGGEGFSEGGEGGQPVELPPAVLLVHYTFDDISSFTAKDSSGNGKDGTLTGLSLPKGAPGQVDGSIRLDSTQKQYVQLPGDVMEKLAAMSVASWVKLQSGTAWDRLFDFNAGDASWFYCSLTGWNFTTTAPGTHIAIRGSGRLDPELMLTTPYPIGNWHHVAVVLAPPYLRYYQDGELQSELSNMTLKPSDVGKTHQNWIGRSVYATDPYLDAWLDDFRVYSGALTAAEIKELAAQ